MKKVLKYILAITLMLTVLGCEQFTSKTSGNESKNSFIGQFIDAPVKGCKYKTSSGSGITNQNGTFKYLENETVEFFIGDFKLGSVKGKKIITPLGLVKGDEPANKKDAFVSLSSEEKSKVNVMLQLLQSIDKDSNSSNGIDLSHTINKTFPELKEIKLSDESELAKVVEAIAPGKPIVDAEDALAHFKDQLDVLETPPDTNTSTQEEDYKLINPIYENKLSGTWSVSIEDNTTKEFLLEDENLSAQFVPIDKDELLYSGYLFDIGNSLDDVNITSIVANDDSIKYTITVPTSNALSSPLNKAGAPYIVRIYIVNFKKLSRYEKAYFQRGDVLNRSIYINRYSSISIRDCRNSGFKDGISVEVTKYVGILGGNQIKGVYDSLKKRAEQEEDFTLRVEGLVSPDLRMPYINATKVPDNILDDEQCTHRNKVVNVYSLFRYDSFSKVLQQKKQGVSLSGTWTMNYRTKVYGTSYFKQETNILAADVPLDLTSLKIYVQTLNDGQYWIPASRVSFSSTKVRWYVLTYIRSRSNPDRMDTIVTEVVFSKEP